MAEPRYQTIDSDFRDEQEKRTGFGIRNAQMQTGNVRQRPRQLMAEEGKSPTPTRPGKMSVPKSSAFGSPKKLAVNRAKATATTLQIVLWAVVPSFFVFIVCIVCLITFGAYNMTPTWIQEGVNKVAYILGWQQDVLQTLFWITYIIQMVTVLTIMAGVVAHYSIRGVRCLGGREAGVFKKMIFGMMAVFCFIPGAPILVIPIFGTCWMLLVCAYPN